MGIFPPRLGRSSVRPAALAVAVLVTAVLALCVFRLLPWPPCLFYKYLHLNCPMCGTTRAVFLFARGGFLAAFLENPIWWLWLFWCAAAFADLWHRVVRPADTVGERLMTRAMANRWVMGGHMALAVSALAYRNFVR